MRGGIMSNKSTAEYQRILKDLSKAIDQHEANITAGIKNDTARMQIVISKLEQRMREEVDPNFQHFEVEQYKALGLSTPIALSSKQKQSAERATSENESQHSESISFSYEAVTGIEPNERRQTTRKQVRSKPRTDSVSFSFEPVTGIEPDEPRGQANQKLIQDEKEKRTNLMLQVFIEINELPTSKAINSVLARIQTELFYEKISVSEVLSQIIIATINKRDSKGFVIGGETFLRNLMETSAMKKLLEDPVLRSDARKFAQDHLPQRNRGIIINAVSQAEMKAANTTNERTTTSELEGTNSPRNSSEEDTASSSSITPSDPDVTSEALSEDVSEEINLAQESKSSEPPRWVRAESPTSLVKNAAGDTPKPEKPTKIQNAAAEGPKIENQIPIQTTDTYYSLIRQVLSKAVALAPPENKKLITAISKATTDLWEDKIKPTEALSKVLEATGTKLLVLGNRLLPKDESFLRALMKSPEMGKLLEDPRGRGEVQSAGNKVASGKRDIVFDQVNNAEKNAKDKENAPPRQASLSSNRSK